MTLFVNGEKVDEKIIQAEVERLRPHYNQVINSSSLEEHIGQLYSWSRENVIERVLLQQAAQNDSTAVSNEEIENIYQQILAQHGGRDKFFEKFGGDDSQEPAIKKDIEQRLKFDSLISRITADTPRPTETEIKEFYELHAREYLNPEMVRASHIVKHVTPETNPDDLRAELEEVLKELRQNKAQFADMALKHSDCPDNGGDLGYFPQGHMVPEFDNIVFNMEIGEISDVFQTEFGFHIAMLTGRQPATPATLEEVHDTILEQLMQEKQQKAIENFVDAEKAKATIEER